MCKYNPNYNLCFPSYPKIQFGPLKHNIKSNKEDILETVNTEEDNYFVENSNINHHNSHNFNINNEKNLSKHNTTNIIHHNTNENNITNQNASHPLNNTNIITNNQNEHNLSNENDKKNGKNIFSRKHIPYSEKNNAPNFIKYTGRNLSENKSIEKNNHNNNVEKLNTSESQRKNTINSEKTNSQKISKKKSKLIINSSKNHM